MPLSWNEIRNRAVKFSHEWENEHSENAEAKSFWDGFFDVFGVPRKRIASFERKVKKIDGKDGYIDLLWKGVLLVEHKSRGKNLDRAFTQAKDYFSGLKDSDLPRYILVCDFANFRLYNLEEDKQHEFSLKELYKNIRLFGFIAGYITTSFKEQDPVNIKAAERMGKLHDKLKAIGYEGHELEVYLVRLLFCLFAEDSSIFELRQFTDLIEQKTTPDGQDLAQWLGNLFQVLDTKPEKRFKTLDEHLAAFPYVNGSLFKERLPIAAFDTEMRDIFLDCCGLSWGKISPAIFGALFQSVMDKKLRRNLGAHYTTEKNILKVIKPLFLDELQAEFEKVKNQPKRLQQFHEKLAQIKFLDPACGCGNFLVIAYRELRLLELEVLRVIYSKEKNASLDVGQFNILCDVDQFYGIEIEEFPAQIAQTALWLMDHQMNMRVSEEFGNYFARLPLKKSATIVHGNALQVDWKEVIKPSELTYILGNPPFGGKKEQTAQQKNDLNKVFYGVKGAGVLDFVAPWYRKAADYMAENTEIKTAFVSTNSITQGEQVGVLWSDLLQRGVKIHFAHRTFQWTSEARGKAAVHCVIIGFALHEATEKLLFDYENPRAEAQEVKAKNINPYLVDAPTLFIERQTKPIFSDAPKMAYGSMPIDDGNLILSVDDKRQFIKENNGIKKYIKKYVGGDEFINGIERYCLWLVGISPDEMRGYKAIYERVEKNKKYRLSSDRKQTKELANYPALFGENRQPKNEYLLIPKVSSENREYIPIGFCSPDVIASGTTLIISKATIYHFGVLTSAMHMAWTRTVCGRMKSDYQYSAKIVYNNFPWAQNVTDKQKKTIEEAAQAVLDARAKFPTSTLADLYSLAMPPELRKAHQKLDLAVDASYSKKKFSGDSDRVAFLFELYQQITAPLIPVKAKRSKRAV